MTYYLNLTASLLERYDKLDLNMHHLIHSFHTADLSKIEVQIKRFEDYFQLWEKAKGTKEKKM